MESVELLHKSVNNKLNQAIYDLTFETISTMKKTILRELHMSTIQKEGILTALSDYRYVDDLNDMREGSYIRWIHIQPELVLHRGAIFCSINVTDRGVGVVCRTIGTRAYFTIYSIDEYIFFQKLSKQEKTILLAIDIIQSN